MTEYVWTELRDDAIHQFGGETPSTQLESDLIEIFTRIPHRVAAELPRVARDLADGKIQSGWAIWLARVRNAGAGKHPIVTDTRERDRKVRQAEQWIRAAGIHFDRGVRDPEHPELESEVEQELFGDRGMLRDWAGDELLRARLLLLWTTERPRGEQVEHEAEQRGAAWVAAKAEAAKRARARSEGATSEEVLA